MKAIIFFIYVFIFFFVATLQTVVVPHIEILGASPSFLLILTIITALRQGSLVGCVMGFTVGLFCDVYAPVEWLGAYSLSYCIIGFIIGLIEESFINLNLFPKVIVLFFADFFKDIIYFFAIGKSGNEIPELMLSVSFPNAIYTALIGTICFYLLTSKTKSKIEIYK